MRIRQKKNLVIFYFPCFEWNTTPKCRKYTLKICIASLSGVKAENWNKEGNYQKSTVKYFWSEQFKLRCRVFEKPQKKCEDLLSEGALRSKCQECTILTAAFKWTSDHLSSLSNSIFYCTKWRNEVVTIKMPLIWQFQVSLSSVPSA